jgi:hypothetical protein
MVKLRGSEEAAKAELVEIRQSIAKESQKAERLSLRQLATGNLRPIFIVGMLLVFFQNFCGINTIIYYAPTLLVNVGFGAAGAILAKVGIGMVNMLMTLPGMYLIDRAGRRPLLLYGGTGHVRGNDPARGREPVRAGEGAAVAGVNPGGHHHLHRLVLDRRRVCGGPIGRRMAMSYWPATPASERISCWYRRGVAGRTVRRDAD